MSAVPVVSLPTSSLDLTSTGFSAPDSLQKRPPSEWQPPVLGLRPASYPTLLSLERATEFALRNLGEAHAGSLAKNLVDGSTLLLIGLLGGNLSLRWLQVAALRDCPLRHALAAEAGLRYGTAQRIGLIEDNQSVTWGYFGCGNIPVLAGIRNTAAHLTQLRLIVTSGHDRKLAWLLNQFREPRRNATTWTHSVPWMALVDSALRHANVLRADSQPTDTPNFFDDDAVAVAEDVRSIGPFRFPEADGQPRNDDAHWLAYSPQFVVRFAQALATPPTNNDQQRTVTFGPQSRKYAVLGARIGLSDADFTAVGGGNVIGQLEPPPPTTDLAKLATSPIVAASGAASGYNAYLKAMQTNLGSLVKAARDTPWRLSDLARAVARYAPQVVGEAPAAQVSPRARALGGNAAPSENQLSALRASGDVFTLTAQDLNAPCAPMLFIEKLRPNDVSGVGDLSLLGTALWLAFVANSEDPRRLECFDTGWFVVGKQQDEPLLQYSDDWICETHKAAEKWWESDSAGNGNSNRALTAQRLATVQRFATAYGAAPADLPAAAEGSALDLSKFAVRAFIRRVFDGRIPRGLLEAAGQFECPTAGEFKMGDNGEYGVMPIRVDLLRA